MRKSFVLLSLFISLAGSTQNNIGIGTGAPDASAALDVTSTSKGMLIPRLTTGQRTAIASPATGLLVFDATTESFWFKSATNWVEVVDTSNNVFKKSGNNIYTTGNTHVGIGTSSPLYDLHISQTNANIGLTDETTGKLSGTITASDEELIINSYRHQTTPGHLILQRGNNFPSLLAGNVGIGIPFTSAPTAKLQVQGGSIITINVADSIYGGLFQIGSTTAVNLALDNDEIQARTDGAASDLYLQKRGGHIRLEEDTKITKNNFNMLPQCYGVINSNGTILNGTGNFTAVRIREGEYRITPHKFISESNSMVIVTPFMTTIGPRYASYSYPFAGGAVEVTLSPIGVNGDMDGKFAFIIYKL